MSGPSNAGSCCCSGGGTLVGDGLLNRLPPCFSIASWVSVILHAHRHHQMHTWNLQAPKKNCQLLQVPVIRMAVWLQHGTNSTKATCVHKFCGRKSSTEARKSPELMAEHTQLTIRCNASAGVISRTLPKITEVFTMTGGPVKST